MEKRKFLTLPGLELGPLGRRYTDYAIPAPVTSTLIRINESVLIFILRWE
jgi:hypothetical protein